MTMIATVIVTNIRNGNQERRKEQQLKIYEIKKQDLLKFIVIYLTNFPQKNIQIVSETILNVCF